MSDPQALADRVLAERVRQHMYADDRAPRMLGIVVTAIAPGQATTAMTVREDMLNGHGTCHGGLIATLADTAFAYACNSYDELTVASGFAIELLAPGRAGDVLTAVAVEISKGGRTGLYDVTVTSQRDERIALFRGRSYTAKGKRVTNDDANDDANDHGDNHANDDARGRGGELKR